MNHTLFITSTVFHALGMISLIIGSLKQIPKSKKTINRIQLYGAFIVLGSGLLLAFIQDTSAIAQTIIQTKIALKLSIAISLCAIATIGIRRSNWPAGYYLASFLVLANIVIATTWKL